MLYNSKFKMSQLIKLFFTERKNNKDRFKRKILVSMWGVEI